MISRELFNKYHIDESVFFNEVDLYHTFLIQTDHIPNKIIEAQILNEEVPDYTDILAAREYARKKINELEEV